MGPNITPSITVHWRLDSYEISRDLVFLTAEDFLLDLIPMIYGKRKVLSCFPFSIGGSGGELKLFCLESSYSRFKLNQSSKFRGADEDKFRQKQNSK